MRKDLIYLFLGCFVPCMIQTDATRAELVGWWMFDEGTGMVAVDSSGNGNDGTLQGAPHWVDGKIGGALEFNGTSNHVDCGNAAGLDITGAMTIAAWIYPKGPGDSDYPRIVDKSNGTGGADPGYKLYLRSAENYLFTLSAGGAYLSSTLSADLNAWNFTAFTTDGTQWKLFLNGRWKVWNEPLLPDSSSNPLFIANSPAGDRHFEGILDDVRVYNRALKDEEIQRIMSGEEWPYASDPSPADGALCEDTWVTLNWSPGDSAASHDVYFGESFVKVSYGIDGTFRGNQLSNDFLVGLPGTPYPDGLVPETTYYWRIDEVDADGVTRHRGDVWSFFVSSGEANPSAVSTFHCIGLYWSPRDASSDNVCQVHYRALGSTDWKEALPLWYDDRAVGGYPAGYRGSIVHLDPGTVYEIRLELLDTGTKGERTAETWSEEFPIAKTVYLPGWTTRQTLRITESGSPDGYILYTPSGGSAGIDVGHNQDYCITVNASYVIIRGLNLKGANRYGIRLYDCHDVVIEECDISDFSRIEDDGWGNRGAAIFSDSNQLERIIVQRNKMHHPDSDSNTWNEYRSKYGSYHPRGPKVVGYVNSAGNHVIRYNEIYSDDEHYFEDCISSGSNNFPNRDSDIYGNYIANCWDDGIEAEDDNCNVRIWGNFIEWTFVKVAIAPTKLGPVYIWRNIAGVSRKDDIHSWNEVSRGGFLKTSDIGGGGKIYVFHNTLLQPEQPQGVLYPLGCEPGLGHGGPMLNTMSRNNILQICNPSGSSIYDRNYDPLGNYDYDLFNGNIKACPGAERNGIKDVPIYNPANGDGEFALDPFGPGYDAGVVIPNFNDHYHGAAPDIGAHEAGSPPMEFGVNAYR